MGEFVTRTFPAALYRLRYWWLTIWVANLAVAAAIIAWTMRHPELYSKVLSKTEIDQLVNTDFASYYSEYAHHEFATMVWVNNAWVSGLCIALGVFGFPVIGLLWNNIFNVGVIGALMFDHHRASLFFGMILPHGLLELTAVFVAAAAGSAPLLVLVEPGTTPSRRCLRSRGSGGDRRGHRAGRRAARERRHRRLRDAVRVADLGAGRHRRARRARLLRLCLGPWAAGRSTTVSPETWTVGTSGTPCLSLRDRLATDADRDPEVQSRPWPLSQR